VLVDGFQKRFVAVQLLWMAGFLLLFLSMLFGPLLWPLLQETASPRELEAASTFLDLHRLLWPALLVLLLGLSFAFLHISHRVAGPLYRFRRVLRGVAAGTLTMRVRLRTSDYLQDEAAVLDSMIQTMRERIARAQADAKALATQAAALQTSVSSGAAPDPDDMVRLADRAARLSSSLDAFVTVGDDPEQ
jgi:methyl-accepting chemotaxis protein